MLESKPRNVYVAIMKGFNVILHSLEKQPEAWEVDRLWAKHENGLTIWIGSGVLNCRIEKPFYQELSVWERFKLYRTIKKLEV